MSQTILPESTSGTSNAVVMLESFNVTPHMHKWLFDIQMRSDEGVPFPELCVFWADEDKMNDYANRLRAKGHEVAVYNISALERDPYVTIEDILAD